MFKKLIVFVAIILLFSSLSAAADVVWLNRNSKAGAENAYVYYQTLYRQQPNAKTAWQFARAAHFYAYNFIADYNPKVKILYEGIDAALYSIKLNPNNPEPHFWLASCYGSIVEASGLLEGFHYVGAILDEINAVIKLAPGFLDGAAYAVRARVYFKAPGWPLSVGDLNKSADDFVHAFKYATGKNRLVYRFYVEYLLQTGNLPKARETIAVGLALPLDRENLVEDEKEIATLKKLKNK
jgi:hypothetical protein